MLTSEELTRSSTMSEMCLFSSSSVAEAAESPFTCGWLREPFCESESILMVWGGEQPQSVTGVQTDDGSTRARRRIRLSIDGVGGMVREKGLTGSESEEVRVASSDRSLGNSVAIIR